MNQLKINVMLFTLLTSLFVCNVTLTFEEENLAKEPQREVNDAKIREANWSLDNFHKKIWERIRTATRVARDKAAKGFHFVTGNRFKAPETVKIVQPVATEQSKAANFFTLDENPKPIENSDTAQQGKNISEIDKKLAQIKAERDAKLAQIKAERDAKMADLDQQQIAKAKTAELLRRQRLDQEIKAERKAIERINNELKKLDEQHQKNLADLTPQIETLTDEYKAQQEAAQQRLAAIEAERQKFVK
jgi:hypothetical protein